MSNACAVCYATDINFLLPTLVSAASLRKFVPADKADVFIFLVDSKDHVEALNRFLTPQDIQIIPIDSTLYQDSSQENFKHSPISAATLARFFLDDMLPDTCKRIIYLDGDTWLHSDPSALIETPIPDGKLAAVEDMMSFRYSHLTPRGRPLIPYFKGLHLHPRNGYFNAGVFATSRQTWRALSAEAYSFFKNNPGICRYNDQSALNAIIGDRRLRLSLKWNFQTPFRLLHIEDRIKPSLYHFHSHPKPWMGPCAPWKEIYPLYMDALAPFETLHLPIKKLGEESIAAHNKMNWRKNLLQESSLIAKFAVLHLGIDNYEKNAWL